MSGQGQGSVALREFTGQAVQPARGVGVTRLYGGDESSAEQDLAAGVFFSGGGGVASSQPVLTGAKLRDALIEVLHLFV